MEEVKHPHLAPFKMLGTAPGVCPLCAKDHPADLPHNQQSLVWQYDFYGKNGVWPKWKDAMAHCSDEVKMSWIAGLAEKNIFVNDDDFPLTRKNQELGWTLDNIEILDKKNNKKYDFSKPVPK